MIIRSREVTLALAAVGLLSYAACTAEKASMAQAPHPATLPSVVDGVFASNEHLLPVYFELNKTKVPDSTKDPVKSNAEWLANQPPFLVRIVGFADSRGSLEKNERVAMRRASALRDAYVALGIPRERISVITRGAEAPACEPVTEDCLAKSRRCDTLIEDKFIASR